MKDDSTLVSVIMPVYNSEKHVAESIESILNQTHRNLELIIFNDASTDGSHRILKEFSDKDKRIKIINSEKNVGVAKARNSSIAEAKGKYIVLNDSDDLSHPERIQHQIRYLENHPKVALCGSYYEEFSTDKKSKIVKEPCTSDEIKLNLLTYNCIANSTVAIRSDIAKRNSFDETYEVCEDYQLWCNIALKHDISILPEKLVRYRIHGSSLSRTKKQLIAHYDKTIKKHYLIKLFELECKLSDEKLKIFNPEKKLPASTISKILEFRETILQKNEEQRAFCGKTLKKCINTRVLKSVKYGEISFNLLKKHKNFYDAIPFYIKILLRLKSLRSNQSL